MIRITVSSKHPVTVVAADKTRFHFARIISASKDVMRLQLRKAVTTIALLNVRSVIIETFAQLSDVRLGSVTIEIDCLNISRTRDRFLKVQCQDSLALDIQVTPEKAKQ
jgi:hypothetical protein